MEIVFSVITQTDLYGFFFPAQMKVILCDCPIHNDFGASFVLVRFFYLTQNQSPDMNFQ